MAIVEGEKIPEVGLVEMRLGVLPADERFALAVLDQGIGDLLHQVEVALLAQLAQNPPGLPEWIWIVAQEEMPDQPIA